MESVRNLALMAKRDGGSWGIRNIIKNEAESRAIRTAIKLRQDWQNHEPGTVFKIVPHVWNGSHFKDETHGIA